MSLHPRLARWLRRFGGGASLDPAGLAGPQAAEADSDTVIYAVGDIHGRLDLLKRLEAAIGADIAAHAGGKDCSLVYLGDYVDRGRDSCGVIGHLGTRPAVAAREVFLRGNHEQVLLDFLTSAAVLTEWSQFGGLETLLSYGLRPRLPLTPAACEELRQQFSEALPASHKDFLTATRISFETAGHFFVHAGVNPARPLTSQDASDLLWIRDEFLNSTRNFGKRVVHGHTPVPQPELLPNRINVDTGAYITGVLSCAVISGSGCRFLSTSGG